MNINKGKTSLSENIASLLNSAPARFDVEDDDLDQTKAKLVSEKQSDEEFDDDIQERSKIRTQNIDLLGEIDSKYAGKISSRKSLKDSSDISEEEQSDDGGDNSDFESNDELENDDELNDESVSDEGSQDEEIEGEISGSESENSDFQNFKSVDKNQEVSKGTCVRNQLNIWENLLETRIQLQKCLIASNKLPIGENYKDFHLNGGEEYKKKISEVKKAVGNILNKMITLQTLTLNKYPETRKLLSGKRKEKPDDEITSEEENLEESDEETQEPSSKKLKKNQEYEKIISERHKLYKNYRNNVIQKWNEKSRIGMLTKNSNAQNILNQIEHLLSDKSKLIKKTQMKRSSYQILGEAEEKHDEIYNENIYDDDDFYHQLLRELIEFKSSDVTDPVQLTRQWVQLQSMRSKMKRKVDTGATKGRKLRYDVHPKLVNFMAPIDDYSNTWTEEAKNELFDSLFGKK